MMELLKKNDDCYFYYYSSCMKGESCPFRHEASALGIETVCNFWKQGKCSKLHCNFRHMEVRKNRNVIPCYWEAQPSGCRKPHCPFQHKSSRDGLQSENDSSKDLILPVGSALHDSHDHGSGADGNEHDNTPANFVSSPPVDPLVVNFEEESDNESVPSTTPVKRAGRSIHIKTLEEIRLERIQAESAAFYQYDDLGAEVVPPDSSPVRVPAAESPKSRVNRDPPPPPEQLELRKRITGRRSYQNGDAENVSSAAFKVLSLEEIRQSKGRKEDKQNDENSIENSFSNKKQVETVIEPIVEDPKEKVIVKENSDGKIPSRKRAHSPVVFDVSDKKVKQVILFDKKAIEIKSSPSKPTVAVAARKRPHSEDVEEKRLKPTDSDCNSSSEQVDDKTSSSTSSVRPSRKIWRSSRQIKKDEQESIKKCSDIESDTTNSSTLTSSVFTRKLRLRKNNVQSNVNLSLTPNYNLPSQKEDKVTDSVPDLSASCVSNTEESCRVDVAAPLSSPCVNSTPKLRRRSSLAVSVPTPSLHGDVEEDLSLLSPTQDHDMSLGTSQAADDILQDIDDLLND